MRQKYTGFERDDETGLDFAEARYYSSHQGRFTSVDPLQASATVFDPQTWNRYTYALNNPLRYIDPTGLAPQDGFTINNPCAMGEAGCRPVDMGTVTVTGTTSPIEQTIGVVAETLFSFGINIPVGMAGALSFGTVGGPQPTDTLPERLGQAAGNVIVGVLSYDLAAGGVGITVGTGGAGAAVGVPAAMVGVTGVAGAVTNGIQIVTTPIQMSNSSDDRAGKDFTPKGKQQVIEENRANNGGVTKCEGCGVETVPAQKSQRGVRPPRTETQVDHIKPKSKGGRGRPDNGQVLCRGCNRQKSNKTP